MARDLGFEAIDRESDYYFISYSSADQNRIIPIAKVMYDADIPMWYDNGLVHGENWRKQLAQRIGNSRGVIFFISEDLMEKDKSYVQKEYAIATEMKEKSVYIVMLDKINPTKVSDYLCDFWAEIRDIHSVKTYQYIDEEGILDLSVTVQAIKTMLENRERIVKPERIEQNIDSRLNRLFDDVFEYDGRKLQPEESIIQRRINEIKTKKYISLIENVQIDNNYISTNREEIIKQLIPTNYFIKNSNWSGKHFSLPIDKGIKHLVFQVGEKIDKKNQVRYYACEVMQSKRDEEKCVETFYTCKNMFGQSEEINLVFLTFDTIKNDLYINMGLLIHDRVKITKRPMVQHYSSLLKEENVVATSTHDLKDDWIIHSDNKQIIEYDANIDGYITIIVDLEKCLPVARTVNWDEKKGSYISKICLEKDKHYFSFQMVPDECKENLLGRYYMKMSNFEVAMCYKNGVHGINKDEEKALLLLESENTPEAWLEMARIFKTGSLESQELYEEYLMRSKDAGYLDALLESIIDSLTKQKKVFLNEKQLYEVENEDSGLGKFLIAYMLENNLIALSDDTYCRNVFDYYYEVAQKGFKPAIGRLFFFNANFEDLDFYIKCKKNFLTNAAIGSEMSKLCLGVILFFGINGFEDKSKGFELISQASCIPAYYILNEIYEKDQEYKNEEKLTENMLIISEFDITIYHELSMRLLDGIGCNVSIENDKLAFELLKVYANDTNNKTAYNNLAWCYEHGRGTLVDIKKAKELYMVSGSATSYWHLGNLYENENIEKALDFYKKAAEMGNKKAIEKIGSLV